MKTKLILITTLFFCTEASVNAQKALSIQVNSLLAKVYAPTDSKESFQMCTKDTDATSRIISVKDAGRVINDLQQTISNYMTQLGTSSMNSSYSNTATSMPSPEQMKQMQQNAMQMQSMSPDQAMKMTKQMPHNNTATPTSNPALMQEIGKAQEAGGKINVIMTDLSTKVSQLGGEFDQQEDKIKMSGSCDEIKVKGADLALPKCSCVKSRNLDFRQKRVAVADSYLQKLNAILQKYLPDIKNKIAIIDKAESDANYGDSFSMTVLKQQAVSLQQQALGATLPILGIVSQAIEKTGSEYADLVNIKNDHLPEPYQ